MAHRVWVNVLWRRPPLLFFIASSDVNKRKVGFIEHNTNNNKVYNTSLGAVCKQILKWIKWQFFRKVIREAFISWQSTLISLCKKLDIQNLLILDQLQAIIFQIIKHSNYPLKKHLFCVSRICGISVGGKWKYEGWCNYSVWKVLTRNKQTEARQALLLAAHQYTWQQIVT